MNDNDPKPDAARLELYWKKNIRCVLCLLVVWFVVSYGCGILFVDELDKIRIPGTGFKLGFWFAQQGSIVTFLALIGIYVRYMNRLDRQFGVEERDG
jgi:putative solute:sodium symporter small subunit